MKDEHLEQISRNMYFGCLIFVFVFLLIYVLLSCMGISITELNPFPCVLYTMVGFYCPGCGGTRAVKYLMQGDIIKSFYHHPVVLYTVVLVLVCIVSHTLNILTKGKVKAMQFKNVYLYVMVVIIALQCIIKNICVLVYGTYPLIK